MLNNDWFSGSVRRGNENWGSNPALSIFLKNIKIQKVSPKNTKLKNKK